MPKKAVAKSPSGEASVTANHEGSGHVRRWLLILFVFAAGSASAQQPAPQPVPRPAPSLEQIKIAADAGDPMAQMKLAEKVEAKEAEVLYRRAASEGYLPAQGRLGELLLTRSQLRIGLKPEDQAAMAEEGIKWAMLAANQGDKQGQATLARVYLEGKWVKQDVIEAYKWGELSAKNPGQEFVFYSGASIRDAAILKMNAEQMAEAHKRVAAFVPHKLGKTDLPDPSWVQKIRLSGTSGLPDHRLAIINDVTFEKDEQADVNIDGKSVKITCLEITDTSVQISIEGIPRTRELTMPNN